MAKSGTPRHSKPARNPVTINLDPSDVKRVDEQTGARATPPAEPVGNFAQATATKPAEAKAAETKSGPKPEPKPAASTSNAASPPFTAGVKPEAEKPRSTSSASYTVPPISNANQGSSPKSTSGASHLLAGIAGGVIALGGMFALQWGNVIPSPGARVTAEQLAQMEQQIADLRTNPTPAPLDAASRTQFADLQKNVQAAEIKAEAVAGTLTQLQQQVETLPQATGGAASGDIEALTGRLDALESKLTSLQAKVGEAARQPDATALIAANALKTAIDRGGSFKVELDTYASLAPQDSSVEGLKAFADTGVPTVADLNAWFGPVANRIVATENKLPADAGVWDQLVASAKGLVSVRPVAGNVEGEGVGPTTARMEAALHAGDLERAIGEWEKLPADAKAVSGEFANQMKVRRDADALIQRLVADSLKSKAPTDAGAAAPAGN
jgi:hypothetical protein